MFPMLLLPRSADCLRGLLLLMLLPGLAGCSSAGKLASWSGFSGESDESAVPLPWRLSWEAATAEAADSGKVVMLWFTGSDWCRYCTMLEEEVFHTPRFHQWSADKLVPVMLDFPRHTSLPEDQEQHNEAVRERYARMVNSYPTVLFVSPQGEVLGKLGYIRGGAENWIHQADGILSVTW
jgi:protein disulfide-isomerase